MSRKPIDEAVLDRACEAYAEIAGDYMGFVRRRAMREALTAAQQGQAVAWQDEWRAAVAAKLSSYGLSEEAAAVFAASELDEYRAGLCDCAENDPADMVDLMMGVARDAIEIWKTESAGRPFGHKDTAPPPSVPVVPNWITGDGMQGIKAEAHFLTQHTDETVQRVGRRLIERVDKIIAALAQQPAAVDEAMTRRIMADFHANDPGDVWPPDEQGRLRRQALQDAINKHLSAAPALAQQPAAVDEAYPTPRNRAEAVALARLALAHLGVIDAHIDAAIARCETNSAAQTGGVE